MAPRITLIKSYRNKETLRLLELREVAELISQGTAPSRVMRTGRRTCRGSVLRWNRRIGTMS